MRIRRVTPVIALTLVLSVVGCGSDGAEVSSDAPATNAEGATEEPTTTLGALWVSCPDGFTGSAWQQFGTQVTTFETAHGAVIEAMKGLSVPPALAAAVESALAENPLDPARTLTGKPVEVVLPDGAGIAFVETENRVAARISVAEIDGGYRSDGFEYCSADFQESK